MAGTNGARPAVSGNGGPGRHTKLTPELQQLLCQAVAVGATDRLACQYAGISQESLYTWLEKGRAGTQPYAEFAEAFQKAKGRHAILSRAKIEKAASDGTWQASAWIMERKYPEEYGRSVQELHHKVDYAKLSDEQLARLAAGEPAAKVLGPGT